MPTASSNHDGRSPAVFRRFPFPIPRVTLAAPGTRYCSSRFAVYVDVRDQLGPTRKGPPGKYMLLHIPTCPVHTFYGTPSLTPQHNTYIRCRLGSPRLSFYSFHSRAYPRMCISLVERGYILCIIQSIIDLVDLKSTLLQKSGPLGRLRSSVNFFIVDLPIFPRIYAYIYMCVQGLPTTLPRGSIYF